MAILPYCFFPSFHNFAYDSITEYVPHDVFEKPMAPHKTQPHFPNHQGQDS